MKRAILLFICISSQYFAYSQHYDLIITTEGDSIICYVENVNDTAIHFRRLVDNDWIDTYLKKSAISDYHLGIIVKKVPIRRNSIYIEASIQPYIYFWLFSFLSLNYERLFISKNDNKVLFMRMGYGKNPSEPSGLSIFPLETGYSLGKKHCFEFGGGFIIVRERLYSYTTPPQQTSTQYEIGITLRAGYRYRGTEGFLIRIAPVVMKQLFKPTDFIWWGGLSFGYSF